MGPTMKLKLAGEPQEFDVEIVARQGASIRARIDGVELEAQFESSVTGHLVRLGDRTIRTNAARRRDSIVVAAGPAHFELAPVESLARRRRGGLAAREVVAPMPGKVLKILVAQGDLVEHGAALLVLEAMKMETTLYAESSAAIAAIRVAAGDMVDHGAVLLELTPPPSDSSEPESSPPAH
jgi:3-methylcrotonyl-CoA carboxylase alpha subunit